MHVGVGVGVHACACACAYIHVHACMWEWEYMHVHACGSGRQCGHACIRLMHAFMHEHPCNNMDTLLHSFIMQFCMEVAGQHVHDVSCKVPQYQHVRDV